MTVDLPALVAATVELKPISRLRWRGLCPFHVEKTPSFDIFWASRRREWLFVCHSCDAKGDSVDWVMQTRHVDYREAKHILGEPVQVDPALIAAQQAAREQARRDEWAWQAFQAVYGVVRPWPPGSDPAWEAAWLPTAREAPDWWSGYREWLGTRDVVR